MVIYTTGRARVRLHAAEEGELCRSHIKTCRNVGKKEYCSLMSIKFNVQTKNTDTAGSVELCSLLLHSLNLPELNQPKLFLLLQTCLIIQSKSVNRLSHPTNHLTPMSVTLSAGTYLRGPVPPLLTSNWKRDPPARKLECQTWQVVTSPSGNGETCTWTVV